jgi:ferredoxin
MAFPLWPRRSTRAFLREGRRMPDFSLFDLLHGYFYARWPYLYIGVATGEHVLARRARPLVDLIGRLLPSGQPDDPDAITFADTYHGKVVPPAEAQQLISVRQDIRLTDLEQVIPYKLATDIVLQQPDHIMALECPCRASRPNPCRPLDVCLIVGEPFASFVAEHHPRRSRALSPAEAADVLRAEHERGHVQHAFFKDAMLGRFYAICNCCACCCGAMQAQRNGVPMLAASGYVAERDESRCRACGDCAAVCPFGAMTIQDGRVTLDAAACMGCGVCVTRCRHGALRLRRDAGKGIPLDLRALSAAH